MNGTGKERPDAATPVLDELRRTAPPGWRIDADPHGVWIHAEPDGISVPESGWKLHVSATVWSATDVLERVLPVVYRNEVAFKVAATPKALEEINEGIGGLGQAGKFITIYPSTDERALKLAAEIDAATSGLAGPRVPTDRPLRPGSLVHYRYGAFIEPRDGKEEPEPPDDPFVASGIADASRSRPIAGRFLLTFTRHRSVRGAVHLAVDLEAGTSCVVKSAWRHARAMPDGTDARDQLRREAETLDRLADVDGVPRAIALVEDAGDLFLALELLEGPSIAGIVEGKGAAEVDQIRAWARDLCSTLAQIHSRGLVYRDLNPENVLITPEGARLIDFELTCRRSEKNDLFVAGTPGYMSPQQSAGDAADPSDDVFALGAVMFLAAAGEEPPPGGVGAAGALARAKNPAAAELADVIAAALEPNARERASLKDVAAAVRLRSARTQPEGALDAGKR